MKKFVCELCQEGSLLKKEGMYVCQNCGTQYTLEEARKLLVDVPDGDNNTAISAEKQISKSSELDNYFELARRARQSDNAENAAEYYGKALVLDPSSWEANFYSVYYKSRLCKIAEIQTAAANMANCIPPTLELIKTKEDESNQSKAVGQIVVDCEIISDMFAQAAFNQAFNISKSNSSTFWMNFLELTAGFSIRMELGNAILQRWPDEIWANEYVHAIVSQGREAKATLKNRMGIAGFKSIKEFDQLESSFMKLTAEANKNTRNIEMKKKEQEEAVREAYWSEHAEEKAALEQKKEDLENKNRILQKQITAIKNKKLEVPSLKRVIELDAMVDSYRKQQNNLGIFKVKEKKELQGKIDSMNDEISLLRSKAEEEQKPLEEEIGALSSEINKNLDEIIEIKHELLMNRQQA